MSEIEIKKSDFIFVEKRGRQPAENPFVVPIRQSYLGTTETSKVGHVLEVMLDVREEKLTKQGLPKNVVTTVGQIRQAAAQEGYGARVELRPAQKQGRKFVLVEADEDGKYNFNNASHVVIYFAAKDRMKRSSKPSSSSE